LRFPLAALDERHGHLFVTFAPDFQLRSSLAGLGERHTRRLSYADPP
jgi:hypothetical protein